MTIGRLNIDSCASGLRQLGIEKTANNVFMDQMDSSIVVGFYSSIGGSHVQLDQPIIINHNIRKEQEKFGLKTGHCRNFPGKLGKFLDTDFLVPLPKPKGKSPPMNRSLVGKKRRYNKCSQDYWCRT